MRYIAPAVIAALGLTGCASNPALTPASVITQATVAVTGLQGALKQVEIANPALIPPVLASRIDADLTKAIAVAGTFSAGLPATAGAVTAQQVEGYVNDVLDVLAGPPVNGLIPAPANQAVAAVAIVAPMVEAYINQYMPATKAGATLTDARARFAAMANAATKADPVAVLTAAGK